MNVVPTRIPQVFVIEPRMFGDDRGFFFGRFMPEGLWHGFLVSSEIAELLCKTVGYCASQHERSLLWSDASLNNHWPIDGGPPLAARDAAAQ